MKITGQKVIALTNNEKAVLKQARRIVDDLIEEVDSKTIDEYSMLQLSDNLYDLIHSNDFIITLNIEEDAE